MMGKCEYAPVQNDVTMKYEPVHNDNMITKCECSSLQNDTTADSINGDYGRSWIPFLRQLLVCTAVWSQYFQLGMSLGTPTVVIPRMREERGEDYISQEMASWISSATGYASLPWIPILAMLSSYIGRRYTFALGAVSTLIGYSLLYAGDTPQLVLASMIVQGFGSASQLTNCLLILTEYISPMHRGIFLTAKSATFFWGVWMANLIGTFAHWRYIAALGLTCGLYNIGTLFLWPESPYWLASKGKLDQCKEAHQWLKGHSSTSEKELEELMKRSDKPEGKCLDDKRYINGDGKWRQICRHMKTKYFYKSLLICVALHTQFHLSGKFVYNVYAIDIIKDITKSKITAYWGMLILDGVTILGMYIGSGLSKKIKRRRQLFSAGGISVIFLCLMSLYLYLIHFNVVQGNKVITLLLLTAFSVSVSCGPMILNTTLAAELLPLHLRGTCSAFVGFAGYFLMGTTLKVAPWIFSNLDMSGAFLLYGLTSGIFLVLLYMYLPETKDKTLKEIETLIISTGSKLESK